VKRNSAGGAPLKALLVSPAANGADNPRDFWPRCATAWITSPREPWSRHRAPSSQEPTRHPWLFGLLANAIGQMVPATSWCLLAVFGRPYLIPSHHSMTRRTSAQSAPTRAVPASHASAATTNASHHRVTERNTQIAETAPMMTAAQPDTAWPFPPGAAHRVQRYISFANVFSATSSRTENISCLNGHAFQELFWLVEPLQSANHRF
jgi:hypothetical protein